TRNGTANLFVAFEPLAGVRHVEVTDRRASRGFAHFAPRGLDEGDPAAERGVFVLDNLSTPAPAAFSEAFEPAAPRRRCERGGGRLGERVEWHYTRKHGSWLNVAELERSVLARQCLYRRIPDLVTLRREVATWEADRNAAVVRVDWLFTTADARTKLKRLYPS